MRVTFPNPVIFCSGDTLHCRLCADHTSSITFLLNSYFQMRMCKNCIFYSVAFYLCSPSLLWGILLCLKTPFSYWSHSFFFFSISEGIQETNVPILFVVHFSLAFLLLSLEFWVETDCSNNLELLYLFFWGLKG